MQQREFEFSFVGAKKCARCKIHKPIVAFGNCNKSADGHQSYCRPCKTIDARIRYKINPERLRNNSRNYYKNHRDICIRKSKEYVGNNKELVLHKARKYHYKNRKACLERMKKYRLANLEKMRKKDRDFSRENPEKMIAKKARRRSIKKNANVDWADQWVISEIYALAIIRSVNTGVKHHVDHIVPLVSKKVCGLHCEHNLQIIEGYENQAKGNRWWPDMPEDN